MRTMVKGAHLRWSSTKLQRKSERWAKQTFNIGICMRFHAGRFLNINTISTHVLEHTSCATIKVTNIYIHIHMVDL